MPNKSAEDVREIIIGYLEDEGFDGLLNTEQECCCMSDDLGPCESGCLDCQPGKNCKRDCDKCKDKDHCEASEWNYQMLTPEEYARRYGKDEIKPEVSD